MSTGISRVSDTPHAVASVQGVQQVMPREAFRLLSERENAILVDVRTEAEWKQVGVPDLSALSKTPLLLSWRLLPDFAANPAFMQTFERQASDKNAPVIFLCKTGGRSQEAACTMAARGYTECYNIVHGFEGEPDASGQFGAINGWKAEGLTWGRV